MKNPKKHPKITPEEAAEAPQPAPEGPSGSGAPHQPTSTPESAPGASPAASEPNASHADALNAPQADPQIASLTADLQRTRADFENFRKQAEIQRENAIKTARLQTVFKLLPLLDDLGRAIATYPELDPLAKSLAKATADLNLTPIDSNPGTEFDPDLHDAAMVEGEGDHEVIAETLRPGYYYEGEVLRPAMVKVQKTD